jgi:hypothetical protein
MYSSTRYHTTQYLNFCNWVISPAFGLFQPSKFGLHKTSSNRKERANPIATVEVECVAVTGGMLCALSISDSPKKLKRPQSALSLGDVRLCDTEVAENIREAH